MFATDNLIMLAIVLLLIWNGMTLLQFVTLMYYKFRIPTFEIIQRDEIGMDVEEMIKPLEDFLKTKGFSYRSALKHDGAMVGAEYDYHKLYYYHEDKGIHAYIDTQPYRGALQSAKITYDTIYESKNICTTVDGMEYAFATLPESVYFFDYYHGDYEKVYQAHLKDRLQEGEVVLKEVFTPEGLKAYQEYIEALSIDAYQKAGYVRITSYGYRFVPSIKLWKFSKRMIKGYRRYHKVLTQEQRDTSPRFEDKKGQINGLLNQMDAMAKPRGESNKMLWFIGSMVAFAFLFGLFGFSLIDIVLLVIILLVHELGHFLAMRYFGYTDTSIFFLPFGAATVGKKSKRSAFEEYIVYLAGPLPGIVIGIVLLTSVMSGSPLNSGIVNTYAIMSIVVNYLNLLPIYPLDGGRIMQILFLLRYPRAQFYFYLISLAMIIFAMIWFQDYILLIFVVILGLAFKQNYYISKLMGKLLEKKDTDMLEKVDVATVLVEDEQYKTQSLSHKANIAKQVIEILQTSKPGKWLVGLGFGFYLLLLLPPMLPMLYAGVITSSFESFSPEAKKELNSFDQKVREYRRLTQSDEVDYTIESSIEVLEKYLKPEQLTRGKVSFDENRTELPCKIPDELARIYHHYNGIANIIPYEKLLNDKELVDEYQGIRKDMAADGTEDTTKDYVTVVANEEGYGLAYKCSEEGLYNFDRYGYESDLQKAYYNFNHFLKVTAEAYKNGAYYYGYDGLEIDQKKLAKIEKAYLSERDKERYRLLLDFYEKKSLEYLNSSESSLKKVFLNEMGSTYDEALIPSVERFLSSKEDEVVSSAIYSLGKVGDRSVLPRLLEYLKSEQESLRNMTLLSIADIVDTTDQNMLKQIYPLLNDESRLVRLSAYEVIDKISDQSSLPYLLKLFDSEAPACKMSIVKTFGKMESVEALPLLEAYLTQINKMDFSESHIGGFRGDDPHPRFLKDEVEKAITKIKLKHT